METVQYVRIADVVIIAPILIYAGFKIGIETPLGILLVLIGIGTLFYNGYNFYDNIK